MPTNDAPSNNDSTVHAGVVIVCHNQSAAVLDAIRSILQQDYPEIYLAIINDGSTDSSEAAIRSLMNDIKTDTLDAEGETFTVGMIGKIPTILISHTNVDGIAISKNKGMMATWKNVKYYTFLEATSTFMPDKLSKCIKVLNSDPNIGLVYHNLLAIKDHISYPMYTEPYRRRSLEQNPIVAGGSVIPRSVLEAVGIFEHGLVKYDDWDMWLRLTERYLAVHIPEMLGTYIDDAQPLDINAMQAVRTRTQARKV